MPLSEYEQRVLEELERDLGADPKLKNAMARPRRSSGRLLAAGLGVVAGLGIIVGGVMSQQPLLGVAGFGVMIAAVMWVLLAPAGAAKGSSQPGKGASGKASAGKAKRPGFMERLEQRFDDRRERGEL